MIIRHNLEEEELISLQQLILELDMKKNFPLNELKGEDCIYIFKVIIWIMNKFLIRLISKFQNKNHQWIIIMKKYIN